MVEQSAHGDGINIQVGNDLRGDVYINHGRTPVLDGWPRLVAQSGVWRHVADPEPVLTEAVEIAAALERAHAELAEALADDPWFDADLPTRFVDNVGWLLGKRSLELSAAEGALFTLLPLVYHVVRAEAVVEGPGQGFEEHADHHPLLRTRSEGPDGAPIQAWLLHRWLTRRELDPTAACGDSPLLDPTRVRRLLRAVHRGPSVGGREFLDSLYTEDTLRHHGVHPVRERRLALLLALAHAVSIEPHTFPTVIAEHLAIPDPVDLAQLRTTLRKATWSGQHIPVLRATCHHAATIEALRDHVTRTDELLHALHRATRDGLGAPMPALPTRLSSDGVAPADASLAGWASFTLDTTRVRELLIGEALYKDRDLAVRELYQNALDACRYRKARTEHLDRVRTATYTYDGSIEIEQGVDPDGRHYLECRDNGIGMGETELRGVFCQAGSRFAEHPDFLAEQSDWSRLDPPIRLYPNSRFGIGVLSYFMLAEEIVVTTCRMGKDGVEGPVLRATIFGPGHLFRISKVAEQGTESGTTVRLYLKLDDQFWDGIEALEKVLRIAEFRTVARNRQAVLTWDARVLRLRAASGADTHDLSGPTVEWGHAPPGVDVHWCWSGGALLVDGLVVGTGDSIDLKGVIVNLTGEWSPRRLTVDRSEVLDDLDPTLLSLLAEAAEAALDSELYNYDWLFRVHEESGELGAILVDAAVKRGHDLVDGPQARIARTGLFKVDRALVPSLALASGSSEHGSRHARETSMDIPDEVLLWRLAAHEHSEGIRRFPAVFAAYSAAMRVSPTRQFDWWLLVDNTQGFKGGDRVSFGDIVARLRECGADCLDIPTLRAEPATAQTVELLWGRWRRLLAAGCEVNAADLASAANGSQRLPEDVATLWRSAGIDVSEIHIERACFWLEIHRHIGSGLPGWYTADRAPLPGQVVRMCLDWRMDAHSVVERLQPSGLEVDLSRVPSVPGEEHAVMLSCDGDGRYPWLDPAHTVLPQSILASASELGREVHEVADFLRNLGFKVAPLPADASTAHHVLLELGRDHETMTLSHKVVFSDFPRIADTIERLQSYGFAIPMHVPDTASPLDDDLFASEDGVVDWHHWQVGAEIPVVVAVRAAFLLDAPLSRVLDRMRAWGVSLSAWELPAGMTFETATKVARVRARPDDTDWGITDEPLSLIDLYVRAVRLDITVVEVAEMLRGLGYVVPDVEEMVVDALKRVPVVSQPGAAP